MFLLWCGHRPPLLSVCMKDGALMLSLEHPDKRRPWLHGVVGGLLIAHCPWLTLQAKLQRAVDLVVQVLSPTNGSYEPLKVEPGGSARLKVAQTNSAKTSGAPAKPKVSQETTCLSCL